MSEIKELKLEMKKYEESSATKLAKKTPVFIKLNVCSYAQMTKHLRKPYDVIFANAMQHTMMSICEVAHGAIFAYSNFDEITVVLTDYHKLNSNAWFSYDVQKMSSVVSSIATVEFNSEFNKLVQEFEKDYSGANKENLLVEYKKLAEHKIMFSSHCFNVPENRVCDMLYWRQKECTKNIIQSIGRMYFENDVLVGKCNDEILEMLRETYGIDWVNLPVELKRGVACTKGSNPFSKKKNWAIDKHMPLLIEPNQDYIKKILDSVRKEDDEEY